jgi:hypothetical protein
MALGPCPTFVGRNRPLRARATKMTFAKKGSMSCDDAPRSSMSAAERFTRRGRIQRTLPNRCSSKSPITGGIVFAGRGFQDRYRASAKLGLRSRRAVLASRHARTGAAECIWAPDWLSRRLKGTSPSPSCDRLCSWARTVVSAAFAIASSMSSA